MDEHAHKYKPDAWQHHTIEELQWWVKLLTKRAGMRTDEAKREKDLADAANYQKMLDLAGAMELR